MANHSELTEQKITAKKSAENWSLHNKRLCCYIRLVGCLIGVLGLLSQTGCQVFDQFRQQPGVQSPIAFSELPQKQQLIDHLTGQTEKVRQLQTDVRVSIDGLPNLRGNLVVEKPNRLRMNAGLLGVTELGIDVGSNDDVFWFWAKAASQGGQPGIYFARHSDYQASALQRKIPIEPSWLIDAFGLWHVEPGDRVEGPFRRPQDGRLQLVTYRNVANQLTIRTTVIDPKYGWIVQQSIYDSAGQLLAYTNSKKHEYYPENDVNLPSLVEIVAVHPGGPDLKLAVKAGRFKVNAIYGDPEQLWSMPNPGDVPLFNLAEASSAQLQNETFTATAPSLSERGYRTSSNAVNRQQAFINNIR